MCTVLLPPGVNPIAVNKYIITYRISYHITSYHISYIISKTQIVSCSDRQFWIFIHKTQLIALMYTILQSVITATCFGTYFAIIREFTHQNKTCSNIIESNRDIVIIYSTSQLDSRCQVAEYSTLTCRDSSDGTATRYGLDSQEIESRWRRDYLHLSRPALRPTQPPIQWVPGLSRG
jgi:hypothetical protein